MTNGYISNHELSRQTDVNCHLDVQNFENMVEFKINVDVSFDALQNSHKNFKNYKIFSNKGIKSESCYGFKNTPK